MIRRYLFACLLASFALAAGARSWAAEPPVRFTADSGDPMPLRQVAEYGSPSWWDRFTGSVSGAARRGREKVTGIFRREPKRDPDPISIEAGTGDASPEFYVSLARFSERSGKLTDAEQQYQAALDLDSNHLAALVGMGRLYDRQGRLQEAESYYVRATQKHPQEAVAWNDLGLCLARQGRLEDSAACLDKAVRLQPTRALYRNNLATVLVQLNQSDAAYQHLVAVHPPAISHYNLGYLLNERGEIAAAREHFAQAAAADPNLTAAAQWVAVLDEQLGLVEQTAGAVDELSPVIVVSDEAPSRAVAPSEQGYDEAPAEVARQPSLYQPQRQPRAYSGATAPQVQPLPPLDGQQ